MTILTFSKQLCVKPIKKINLFFQILVFFVKICRPEPLHDRLIQASRDEYITRHLIDGRIITCDQRISIVVGYLTEEVSGHSAFQYMHRDDVRWVIIALRQSKFFLYIPCNVLKCTTKQNCKEILPLVT